MRQKSVPEKEPATQVVKNIRRATRRHFSAEDKIRIVLGGLRGEDSIAELCRREGIVQNLYYRCRGLLRGGRRAGTAIPVDPPVPAGIRSEHSVGIRDDTPWVDRSTPAASSRC